MMTTDSEFTLDVPYNSTIGDIKTILSTVYGYSKSTQVLTLVENMDDNV
jgi:hypothetical protein